MTHAEELARSKELEIKRQAPLRLLVKIREPFKDVSTQEIEREVASPIGELRREKRDRADFATLMLDALFLQRMARTLTQTYRGRVSHNCLCKARI